MSNHWLIDASKITIEYMHTEKNRFPTAKKLPQNIKDGNPTLTALIATTIANSGADIDRQILDGVLGILDIIYKVGYVHGKEDVELLIGKG